MVVKTSAHGSLPSSEDSTWYPVIGEPPLFAGAVHDRTTCAPSADGVAFNPVGGPGTTGGAMVTVAVADQGPGPAVLTARTR